jgi:hypothetical protein
MLVSDKQHAPPCERMHLFKLGSWLYNQLNSPQTPLPENLPLALLQVLGRAHICYYILASVAPFILL